MIIYTISPKRTEPMNFPTITIPDPAAVGAWLDQEVAGVCPHEPKVLRGVWSVAHWFQSAYCFTVDANSPEELLPLIQDRMKAHDPLAKLRKDAEARGYGLIKLPTD